MWLYSPVDLTGNVNMIEKLVLGGTDARCSNIFAIKSRLVDVIMQTDNF